MATSIPKSIRATLYIDGKPAEGTMKNLESVTTRLNKELRLLEVGTEAWNRKMGEVKAHQKALQGLKDEIKGTAGMFGFLKSEIGKVGALAVGFLGFQFVADQFRNIIMKNAELSDSLSDVRKTTGLSEEAVLKLNKELGKLDTRTPRKELLDLATVAGKLGISAEEDVLGFVKASNMIGVALGRDLGNTEEAVNTLGKLTDLFQLKDQFGLEESLTKIGSAINELGAEGTASEGYIVEFSKRLGTIAPAAKISIENVLGLAATMDELGQPVEAASTALSQFIISMGKDPAQFAKVAGLSVKEFSSILQKDGNEALIAVLANLKSTGGGVEELAANMGLIGEEGARATATLSALSGDLDKLRQRQKLANDEFAIGDSLLREYNIKNENFAATLDKIGKWFYGIATSKIITNTLTTAAEGFAKWVGISKELSGTLEEDRIKLIALSIEIDSTNTSTARRKEIIAELKTEYPDYLKAIDTEKIRNEDLLPILDKINAAFVLRIAYQKRMETLNDAVQKEADSMNDKYDQEQKLILQLARIKSEIAKDGIKFTIKGNTEQEKAMFIYRNLNNAIREQAKSNGDLNKVLASNKYDHLVSGLNSYGNSLKDSNEELREHRDERKKIEDDIKNFKKSTGFSENETKSTGNSKTVVETPEQLAARIAREAAARAERERKAKEAADKKNEGPEKQALREFESLNDDFKKLGLQRLNDQLSKNEKEVAQEAQKYDQLIQKEKAFLKMKGITPEQKKATEGKISTLEAEKEKAVNDLRVRQEAEMVQKIKELRITLSNAHESELQKEKDNINKFYDDLEKDYAGNEKAIAQLKIDRVKDLSSAELREKERLEKEKLDIESKYATLSGNSDGKRLASINKKYDDEIEALKLKFSKELQLTQEFKDAVEAINRNREAEIDAQTAKSEQDKKDFIIEMAQLASDTTFSIMANNRQAQTEAALSSIEKQRNAELSGKELTETQKQAINDKFNERVRAEKEKAWKADRNAAIAQAVINGALAVTKVLSQTGVLSPLVIPAIVAGTLAQIAVIASQKPPQFAEGGFSNEDPAGYVNRDTVFSKSSSGRPFRAGEAGREWIAPNWMLESPRTANIIGMLENARKTRGFATGGSNGDPVNVNSTVDLSELTLLMGEMIRAQREANDKEVRLNTTLLDKHYNDQVKISNDLNA